MDHFVFSRRFALLKTLLLLKVKLLSLWISIKWLIVFILIHLTDRCHVGEEIFEDNPTLASDSQLDEFEECDGRDSSISDSDWADGVKYPNPMCVRL